MKTRFELGSMGIISSEQKRTLENYVDERLFEQRKDFAEYTVTVTCFDVDVELQDLVLLAENFNVIVVSDAIIITEH